MGGIFNLNRIKIILLNSQKCVTILITYIYIEDGGKYMEKWLRNKILTDRDQVVEKWLEKISTYKNKEYTAHISNDLFENVNKEFVNIIILSVEDNQYTDELEQFTKKLIGFGWPLAYFTDCLQDFKRVLLDFCFAEKEQIDSDSLYRLIKSVDGWIEPIIHKLVSGYSGNWERSVSLQRIALKELSTPLIPIMDNITVMPLIGTIDTERAKLIMENILEGVIKHNSEVVLIDITGVPVVDTMVAHHIVQVSEAIRLVGATSILVGIRPEIALTITNLGIDLTKFLTKSSLKSGFIEALSITNQKITKLNPQDDNIEKMINSLHVE